MILSLYLRYNKKKLSFKKMQWIIIVAFGFFGLSGAILGMVNWLFAIVLSSLFCLYIYFATNWVEKETKKKELQKQNEVTPKK